MKRHKSSFRPRSSSVQSASDILQSTLKAKRLDKEFERYKGFSYWPEVVGEEIAKVTRPEKIIRKKVLVVRVLDSAWAQELSMQKSTLLDRLNDRGVGAVLEDIRFVTGDPQSFRDEDS